MEGGCTRRGYALLPRSVALQTVIHLAIGAVGIGADGVGTRVMALPHDRGSRTWPATPRTRGQTRWHRSVNHGAKRPARSPLTSCSIGHMGLTKRREW